MRRTLRASLTSLGILFGVASVIAMLAIGNGAEQEILAQMKLLGANNIVITPIVEQQEGRVDKDEKKQSKRFSPGLSALDAHAIGKAIPAVAAAVTLEGRHAALYSLAWAPALLGAVLALATGILTLRLLRGIVERGHFGWFAFWVGPLALATLAMGLA